MHFFNCPFCLETKSTKKFKKIYIEPSHRPLPDTDIFSCNRTLFLRNNSVFFGIGLPILGAMKNARRSFFASFIVCPVLHMSEDKHKSKENI